MSSEQNEMLSDQLTGVKRMVVQCIEKTEYNSIALHWANKVGRSYIKASIPQVVADMMNCELETVCSAIADMIQSGDIWYKAKNVPSPLTGAVLTEAVLVWDDNLKQKRPLTQDCKVSLQLPHSVDSNGFSEPVATLKAELGLDID